MVTAIGLGRQCPYFELRSYIVATALDSGQSFV